MKDNRGEGQHHGIKELLLNCNCYFVEVGGIREKRHLRRDVGQRASGSLDRATWAVKQTFSEDIYSGGLHTRLSRQTKLFGISLAFAVHMCQLTTLIL